MLLLIDAAVKTVAAPARAAVTTLASRPRSARSRKALDDSKARQHSAALSAFSTPGIVVNNDDNLHELPDGSSLLLQRRGACSWEDRIASLRHRFAYSIFAPVEPFPGSDRQPARRQLMRD
jgi:hypothetical protein